MSATSGFNFSPFCEVTLSNCSPPSIIDIWTSKSVLQQWIIECELPDNKPEVGIWSRGTSASLASPKFFFKHNHSHVCCRAWKYEQVDTVRSIVAWKLSEKIESTTHSSARSFARTALKFACSTLLASLARSAALTHSLTRSWARGQWNILVRLSLTCPESLCSVQLTLRLAPCVNGRLGEKDADRIFFPEIQRLPEVVVLASERTQSRPS